MIDICLQLVRKEKIPRGSGLLHLSIGMNKHSRVFAATAQLDVGAFLLTVPTSATQLQWLGIISALLSVLCFLPVRGVHGSPPVVSSATSDSDFLSVRFLSTAIPVLLLGVAPVGGLLLSTGATGEFA